MNWNRADGMQWTGKVGPREPTVSLVIPAKNEARNLPHVFAGLPDDIHEVILVDGGLRFPPPTGHLVMRFAAE